MPRTPPDSLIELFFKNITELLESNPAATSSEAYIQHHLEFDIMLAPVSPPYFLRIGINYHGQKVQHLVVDPKVGRLVGWNPTGDALGIGANAKMLLAGYTIFDRDPDEQLMSDTKIGGGDIPKGSYIRVEFKSRGWLGKTKNLDGAQLEKDLDLLKNDQADLLVIILSETAHRKWRGEGPDHQASRRTGIKRFREILVSPESISSGILTRRVLFEGQNWTVKTKRVIGASNCIMPGAEHYVTLCYR